MIDKVADLSHQLREVGLPVSVRSTQSAAQIYRELGEDDRNLLKTALRAIYVKDKYDIRNKLISHKAGELFSEAHDALEASHITGFTAQLHFIVDNILDRLETESSLLGFISKNLSWGVFKDAFQEQADDDDFPFFQEYLNLLDQSDVQYDSPELLLFTIIELVSSTSYSCILHSQPVCLAEYRPYLHRTIDCILQAFIHGADVEKL